MSEPSYEASMNNLPALAALDLPLGKGLRYFRQQIGFTQDDMASALNVSANHIYMCEIDESIVRPELERRFRDRFGIDLVLVQAMMTWDFEKMPASARYETAMLISTWSQRIKQVVEEHRKEGRA